MDERLLIRVVARLVRVHDELGDETFDDAVRGCLVAIGRSAMRAAEGNRDMENVVIFPNPHAYHDVERDGPK